MSPVPQTLYFEKISKYDRPLEPVTVSIPFKAGTLTATEHLLVSDGETPLPVQRRALSHWPDGSIKWLLLDLQVDLPGNNSHTLHFEINPDAPVPPAPECPIMLSETPDGIDIHTGPLAFHIDCEGFRPIDHISINGKPFLSNAFTGFEMILGGKTLNTLGSEVELIVEEEGPLRTVVIVKGKHRQEDGTGFSEMVGRVTAYAGKPYVAIEHGFFHVEDEGILELSRLHLPINLAGDNPQLALGQGYYRTAIEESTSALEMTIDAETLLYQANEHYTDCFYGDFWVDYRTADLGLATTIYQAHQNFPKRLAINPDGIDIDLYPASSEAARIYQGVGKTHRMLLHFHDGKTSLEDITARSLQFQLPDRPYLDPEWYREHNPWQMDFFPAQVPGRSMTHLLQLHDSRPEALGMLHFGDAPDAGYTDQGRGRGSTVWVNNEYDRTHACTLLYALSSERRTLGSAEVTARHWMDVDFCHYSPDPLRHHGQVIHTAHHVTGNVIPSHQWVEGLLDYYHLTGRQEGLDTALAIGDNLLRHMERPEMREPGAAQTRENGWALRAFVALVQATGEQRYRDTADWIVDLFTAWRDRYGGLLAPYTSHTMVRVPFMISIALNSLARYLIIQENKAIEQLIVESAADVLEHCLGRDGVLYYKEYPSLRRVAPTIHAIEAFTHAYRFSGEVKFLKAARTQYIALLDGGLGASRGGRKYVDEGNAVIRGSGGGRGFASSYTSLIIFITHASEAGLLDMFEYPS